MTQNKRQSFGSWGELAAARHLTGLGYKILATNLRTPHGEIDLIVQKEQQILFVEVKSRASSSLGPPEISVTPRKQSHMLAAAQYYIQQHPQPGVHWRIDVISIFRPDPKQPPTIQHFKNVVS